MIATVWGLWSHGPYHPSPVTYNGIGLRNSSATNRTTTGADANPESGDSRFNGALNHLNRVLQYAPGSTRELLRATRDHVRRNPPVCDFSWDTGQPALRYHSGQGIDAELDACASAVENYLFGHEKAPAETDRGW